MPRKLEGFYVQNQSGDGPSAAAFSSTVGPTVVMKRKHQTPEWFANTKKVADFIRARFPLVNEADPRCDWRRCKCRPCHQARIAGKWVIVIQKWFLAHWNDTKVEEIYEWKPGECGAIVQKIRRALRRERLDGRPRTGKPKGRPKR